MRRGRGQSSELGRRVRRVRRVCRRADREKLMSVSWESRARVEKEKCGEYCEGGLRKVQIEARRRLGRE